MLSRLLTVGIVPVMLAALCGSSRAQDITKCVDEQGHTVYGNVNSGKGCTKITVDPVVIPSPRPAPKVATPPGYPKVESGTQKSRDSDRRRILEDELRDKEAQLATLRRDYNNGEPERQGGERNYQRYLDRTAQLKADIARCESDIASIRSELDRLP